MKKIILLLIVAGIMTACGTSKIERQTQRVFKGNWILTDISLPSALVDVSLFDEADSKCFETSEWHFVPNNNKGSYELFNCAPGQRNFVWSVQQGNAEEDFYFMLKPDTGAQKITKARTGYRLRLVSLDDTQMQWEQTVTHEGKPFTIRMNFSKN